MLTLIREIHAGRCDYVAGLAAGQVRVFRRAPIVPLSQLNALRAAQRELDTRDRVRAFQGLPLQQHDCTTGDGARDCVAAAVRRGWLAPAPAHPLSAVQIIRQQYYVPSPRPPGRPRTYSEITIRAKDDPAGYNRQLRAARSARRAVAAAPVSPGTHQSTTTQVDLALL